MSTIDNATTIGIVYQDQQLTIAVRTSGIVSLIEQHENMSLDAALVPLQLLHQDLRAMNPTAYAFGREATLLTDALMATSVHALPCARFDWLLTRSTSHANLGSQLLDDAHAHIARGTLAMPREHAQSVARDLEKFKECVSESGNGFKFPHPDVMAAKLGYFPAKLMAVLLATLPGMQVHPDRHSYGHTPGSAAATGSGYGGHDPMQPFGHDPMQPFGHDPMQPSGHDPMQPSGHDPHGGGTWGGGHSLW